MAPVIKWSGSKAGVAEAIGRLIPDADRYFEPFLGGGAVLPCRRCSQAVCGDIVPELVRLWRQIQSDPDSVVAGYTQRWSDLQRDGHTVFYRVRDSFNQSRDPLDLLFLSRTCVNGLIRFNARGQFNNSFHHTRPGMHPSRLGAIVLAWHAVLHGVCLVQADYECTLADAKSGDFAFLDPPYHGTRGRFRKGDFDPARFFRLLSSLNEKGVRWILTYDGAAGPRAYEAKGQIPCELYLHRLPLPTGSSPFARVMNGRIDPVTESLYVNFDPPARSVAEYLQMIHTRSRRAAKRNQ
jgi:DNA adenine methylase